MISMSREDSSLIFKMFLVLMFFAIVAYAYRKTDEGCDGTLVRGVYWFECIEENNVE